MRAYEFINEDQTNFRGITLRQLNKEKHDFMRRKASLERRQRLIPLMYANPGKALERLEFEKSRLELEQQKTELAATKAEAQVETSMTINGMAKAGSEADQKDRSKVTDMAKTEMRRRKD